MKGASSWIYRPFGKPRHPLKERVAPSAGPVADRTNTLPRIRALRRRVGPRAGQRGLLGAFRRVFEELVEVAVGVDGRGLVLHEAAGVGGGAVGAVEVAAEHAEQGGLLAAM